MNFGKQRILISRFLQVERFNVTNDPHLSLLTEFSGNNYAHVILTAEADSLPTDAKELLHGYGLAGCHSSRSNDLPVHARIDSSGKIRLLWESDVDTRNGHAAIFEVKFGKRQTEQLKHRASVRLNNSLTTLSLLR